MVPPSYTGDAHPLVLPILLRETTYLPAVIRARDQDAATGKRRVRLSYERREYQWNGELDRNKTIKIAIAPMMEVSDDARFAMASCGTRYCVTPAYPQQRIADVIKAAISSGVDVLLLPEMCIPESDLEGMKNMVRVEAAAHLAMHKKSPRLRYVFAGVAGEPTPPATFHTNYVVVIDSGGAQVMKQGKLFRWDMDANWIERLGLHSDFGLTLPLAPDVCVKENVAPWDEIVLVDLTDMGRVLNLICADMSFDLPQDWLLQQCRLDWLYAPIMDRYIPDLAKRNWIVNAAFRAAPGIRAMVTNSMALTYRLNAENLRVSSEHGACNDCGIGLLVDGMSPAHSVYLRITASVGAHSPILKIAEWDPANWDDIPC